jgi:hypothetical protein
MKNKYACLSLCLMSLWLTACVTGNTQEANRMPTSFNSNVSISLEPTPELASPEFMPKAEKIAAIRKDAADKLGLTNIQELTLATQPPEIIAARIQDPKDSRLADNIKILTGERDLNHDGIPELGLIEMTDRSGGSQEATLHFFGKAKDKWKCLTCKILTYVSDNLELVATGRKGDYDIIRFRSKADDVPLLEESLSEDEIKKWDDLVSDIRMKDGIYQPVECRVETKTAKKLVPCS